MTRVAAIDCGTNSLRLLVADLPPDGGPLAEVARRMEIVRLGEGVDRTGVLAPAAIERTRLVLAGYADAIGALGAERVRMVATSASRDARNADDFRAMVLATLGRAPEVVTGDEEARLSFTGAVRGLPPGRYLVVDIGGGSTATVRTSARSYHMTCSAPQATTASPSSATQKSCTSSYSATVALDSSRRSVAYRSMRRRMPRTSRVRARRMVTSMPRRVSLSKAGQMVAPRPEPPHSGRPARPPAR